MSTFARVPRFSQNVHFPPTNMAGSMPDRLFENRHLQLGCDMGMGKSGRVWKACGWYQQPISVPSNRSELVLYVYFLKYAHACRQLWGTESL